MPVLRVYIVLNRRLIRVYTTLIKGDHLASERILIRSKYVFSTSEILSIYIAVGISDDIADIADSKFDQHLHC